MTNRTKKYHYGGLKEALVAAGLDLLERDGLEKLSLRAIAAHVGVSHTAPKNHFDGVRGLLTAIAAEGFRRHAAAMRESLTEDTREARLDAATRGYVGFAMRHPALFRLMFAGERLNFDDPDLQQAGAGSYAVLAEISEGLDWPHLPGPSDPRRAERMLWSFVHGYATLALAGQFGDCEAETDLPFEMVMPRFGYVQHKKGDR